MLPAPYGPVKDRGGRVTSGVEVPIVIEGHCLLLLAGSLAAVAVLVAPRRKG